jgi:hypothetical protein
MGRRGKAILIGAVAVLALLAAGLLGVAAGEGPAGSSSARSTDVEGVGIVPIPAKATAAQATAVYREGMAKALADGASKAQFIAEHEGVALGVPVTTIEDGGEIECSGYVEGEGYSRYVQYEGEQPDFGFARSTPTGTAPAVSGAAVKSAPHVAHRPKGKHGKHPAKKASATSCELTAELTLAYALG